MSLAAGLYGGLCLSMIIYDHSHNWDKHNAEFGAGHKKSPGVETSGHLGITSG